MFFNKNLGVSDTGEQDSTLWEGFAVEVTSTSDFANVGRH